MNVHHAFVFAALLGTVRSTFAVDVCGTASPTAVTGVTVANTVNLVFGASGTPVYSCTCPTGTGAITAVTTATALPAPLNSIAAPTSTTTVKYTISAGSGATPSTVTLTGDGTATNTLVQAYIPQLCTDLLPGYDLNAE